MGRLLQLSPAPRRPRRANALRAAPGKKSICQGVTEVLRPYKLSVVAREGIIVCAEAPGIMAFQKDSELSYPRCYPRLFRPQLATEPRTLNRGSRALAMGYFASSFGSLATALP